MSTKKRCPTKPVIPVILRSRWEVRGLWWEDINFWIALSLGVLLIFLIGLYANQQSIRDELIREIRATTQCTDRAGNWPTR